MIIDAYCRIRMIDQTIPDDVLDFMKDAALEKQAEQLNETDVMLSLPDIRNKLSPIKNLIAMLENGLVKGNVEMHDLVLKGIEQCKKSIAYLAGNGA